MLPYVICRVLFRQDVLVARWEMGRASFTDTFVVVRRAVGWLVDDEYCLGRPGTSVYTARGAVPCG